MSDPVEPQSSGRSERGRRKRAPGPAAPAPATLAAPMVAPAALAPNPGRSVAARRRRARLVRTIAALAVVLIVANLVVLATGAADGDDDEDLSLDFTGEDRDDLIDDGFGETTTSRPSSIVEGPGLGVTTVPQGEAVGENETPGEGEGGEPSVTSTTEAPQGTTTTTVVDGCLDRNDPTCGPFRYEPEPGPNAPLEIAISVDPPSPVVGEQVLISFTFSDADATPVANCSTFDAGEGLPIVDDCGSVPVCPERFGPTSPPAPQGGTRIVTIPHVYTTDGPHTITASGQSSSLYCDHPYGSSAAGRIDIAVGA